LSAVGRGSGIKSTIALSPQDVEVERLVMGLRINDGLDVADVSNVLSSSKVSELCDDGFMWNSDNRIGATPKGRLVLNRLIADCFIDDI
jgi:oxygen-independent coproporphyrinogen-3 oxidase